MRMPKLLFFRIKRVVDLSRHHVFDANKFCILLVRVVDQALAKIFSIAQRVSQPFPSALLENLQNEQMVSRLTFADMGTVVCCFNVARGALLGLVGIDVHRREEFMDVPERLVVLHI